MYNSSPRDTGYWASVILGKCSSDATHSRGPQEARTPSIKEQGQGDPQ